MADWLARTEPSFSRRETAAEEKGGGLACWPDQHCRGGGIPQHMDHKKSARICIINLYPTVVPGLVKILGEIFSCPESYFT